MISRFKNHTRKSKNGINRDSSGRFTRGSGGLINLKKFNYYRAIPLISMILLVGGFSVYISKASDSGVWAPGSSGVRLSSGVTVVKENNQEFWRFEIPASQGVVSSHINTRLRYKRAGSLTLTHRSKGVDKYCTIIRNYTRAIRVRWSGAGVKYSVPRSGDGFNVSGNTLNINKPLSKMFCVTADTGKSNLTISIDYSTNHKAPQSQVAVHRIIKKGSLSHLPIIDSDGNQDQISSNVGKVGFTWTQDNLMIPKKSKSEVANIHMYGWGSLWPFKGDAPSAEADNGETISDRIEKTGKDGQEVMITTCCAPSTFNTTGKAWDLDSSRVRDDKEQLYANRVAELVEKHPQIKYVQVWNEFKGYWDTGRNTWDAESYTRFYNKVYKAVKAKRSSVKVGGGYVVFSANSSSNNNALYNGVNIDKRSVNALQYWLDHAYGLDAISLDAFVAPKDFPKIMEHVRKMQRAKDKPIWWAEFYNKPAVNSSFAAAGSPYDVAKEIVPSMKQGDIALFWAERKFTPDINRPLW